MTAPQTNISYKILTKKSKRLPSISNSIRKDQGIPSFQDFFHKAFGCSIKYISLCRFRTVHLKHEFSNHITAETHSITSLNTVCNKWQCQKWLWLSSYLWKLKALCQLCPDSLTVSGCQRYSRCLQNHSIWRLNCDALLFVENRDFSHNKCDPGPQKQS